MHKGVTRLFLYDRQRLEDFLQPAAPTHPLRALLEKFGLAEPSVRFYGFTMEGEMHAVLSVAGQERAIAYDPQGLAGLPFALLLAQMRPKALEGEAAAVAAILDQLPEEAIAAIQEEQLGPGKWLQAELNLEGSEPD